MEILTTKSNQAKIVSEIKRLNERMRDMERKGLTDTISYQKLSSWVANVPNRVDSKGHIRAIQTYKLTPEQAKRTSALANNKRYTGGAEIKRATKYLERTGQRISRTAVTKQANEYGKTEEYIRTHLEKLYVESIKKDAPITQERKDALNEIMKNDQRNWEQKQQDFKKWYKQTWKGL